MRFRAFVVGSAALLLLLAWTGIAAGAPTPREVLGSELLVKEYLDKLDVPPGRINPLQDALLTQVFPDYLFFVVVYPEASVESLPEPLKRVNVFAVDPAGRVHLLVTPAAIVELFKVGYNPGKVPERCKLAVRVILLLTRARYPEYQFALAKEEIKIRGEEQGPKLGLGKIVAQEGGSGAVEVSVTLNRNCDPLEIIETITLKPGKLALVLPTEVEITAAEKLVKARLVQLKIAVDPVKYVNDPVLVRAFPGRLFFLVPVLDPKVDPNKAERMDIMVVGPGGTLQPLFGGGDPFGTWFNPLFGPAVTDPRIKEAVNLVAHMHQIARPQYQFAAAADPVITVEDNGNKTILRTVPAVGPGGRKWVLTVRLMFGRRGRLVAWWWGFKPV